MDSLTNLILSKTTQAPEYILSDFSYMNYKNKQNLICPVSSWVKWLLLMGVGDNEENKRRI